MTSFRDFEDGIDDVEAQGRETQENLNALDALEQLPDKLEQSEWVDQGIRDIRVADLPNPEHIHSANDFQKVTEEEMRAGLEHLQEMRPIIESGEGANSDYWASVDAENSLEYKDGYRRIYDAFYGHDAIRLTKDGNRYDIVNGRHRIWLAKRMGINTLPARIIERRVG